MAEAERRDSNPLGTEPAPQVVKARREVSRTATDEFQAEAISAGSRDEVLQLIMNPVEVV
jgi:hypothetical protein